MGGIEKLYPVAPQFEDQDLLDLQDDEGRFVIRDEIELVRRADEGFVTDHWRKPDIREDMVYPKLTFVKAFKPLNWYLGTGEYLDDFEHDLQEEIIDRIARIRFGREGYVFLNTFDGDAVVFDGERVVEARNLWDLTDPNGIKVIQEERRVAETPDGDFISYTFPRLNQNDPSDKVSFVKGFPDWRWMIGAGFYTDDIEPVIATKQADMRRSLMTQVVKIALIIATLAVISLALARLLSRRTRRSFGAFLEFFDRAAGHSDPIDPSRLHFSEITALATAANEMVSARRTIEDEKERLQEMLMRSKKMESLGLLTGGVAHDHNNILSGIVSYPALMLMTLPEDSPLREDLEIIQDSEPSRL